MSVKVAWLIAAFLTAYAVALLLAVLLSAVALRLNPGLFALIDRMGPLVFCLSALVGCASAGLVRLKWWDEF